LDLISTKDYFFRRNQVWKKSTKFYKKSLTTSKITKFSEKSLKVAALMKGFLYRQCRRQSIQSRGAKSYSRRPKFFIDSSPENACRA